MNGGNWSILGLTPPEDPVRGDPRAVRELATASEQEARRWEEQVQSLRIVLSESEGMQMEGDYAPAARRRLQAHPNDAQPLARGRAEAGAALQAYAGQLEQAKRESQMALQQGTQAKRTMDMQERNIRQIDAQMQMMSSQVYPAGPAYAAAVQRFNMLRSQRQLAVAAWEQAKAQWQAAQQRALQAGERARQQESIAAQKVSSAGAAAVNTRTRTTGT